MKRVTVLMSTYNGEKYLSQQIDSIFNQINVDIILIIRDDGSTDNTVDIINNYIKIKNKIILIKGKNVGATNSFKLLCDYALINSNNDFYAFSDQDDYWMPEKLSKACDKLLLSNNNVKLYFSNLKIVDSNLNYIRMLYHNNVSIYKDNSLYEISAYGCTCVFSKKALELFCRVKINNLILHDNLIYYICIFLGEVMYDSNSYIKYRQHFNNLSGIKHIGLRLQFNRLNKLLNNKLGNNFENLSICMLDNFSNEISFSDKIKLKNNIISQMSLFNRIKYLLNIKFYNQDFYKKFSIIVRVLLKKL